jgi:hypothetical protein
MTPERIEEIYNALDNMSVKLDPDPVTRGPLYMQELISLTRGYLNEVGVYIQEAHRERHRLEMTKEALEMVFQARSDELLVEDTRVVNLPSIDDRRSMINIILREERKEIASLAGSLKAVSLVEKALRFRHKELDATMSAIRVQRSLILMELGNGSIYGDESDSSRGSKWGRKKHSPPTPSPDIVSDGDDDDLDKDLAQQMAGLNGSGEGGSEPEKESDPEAKPAPEPEAPAPQAKTVAPKQPIVPESDDVSLGEDNDDFDSFLSMGVSDDTAEAIPDPAPEKKQSARSVPKEDPDVEGFLEEDEFSDFLESI